MTDVPTIDRRHFLAVGALTAGGLLLGFHLPGPGRRSEAPPFEPNAFLRIDGDGLVTVVVPRPEMGQGIRTTIAMLVAEELEADWSRVRIEQADLDPRYGEDTQYAGGSNSTPESWLPLRRAGAAAREMLIEAAATGWRVAATTCRAERGSVVHVPSGRRRGYGELAAAAARRQPPTRPSLKAPRDFTIIGRRTAHLDTGAIVTGAASFGLDQKVPGMLYAVIERSPVFGGRIASIDDRRARAVPGVRDVVGIDADALPDFGENSPKMANGVAVVATSTWAAMEGRRALVVTWDPGPAATESTDDMRRQSVELASRPAARVLRNDGDAARALQGAAKRIEAVYELPFVAHAPMEPLSCVAHVRPDGCELWAPTQNPDGARAAVATALGMAPRTIAVHVTRMGGGFGRRFYADFVAEAALVSRAVRAPVQVMWTREDDLGHGFYRPAGYNVMRAGIDASGLPVAWTRHLVSAERGAYLRWSLPAGVTEFPAGGGELSKDDFPAAFVPNFRLEATSVRSSIPRGQWRAIEESTNVFVVQSFLDEVAHLGGRDPLELQLAMLGEPRDVPYYEDTYSTGRLANVLRLAAEQAGWGAPLPPRWGRGIAGCYANEAYTAEVAEVEVEPTGRVRVHRVVVAIDCGIVVNPSGAEAQVEGSVVYGLSAALGQEITVAGGRVQQRTFNDFPVLRIHDMPVIEVHFVPSDAPPLGLGEPALPPIAPAVVNAIFAATGKRVRRLPIRATDLVAT